MRGRDDPAARPVFTMDRVSVGQVAEEDHDAVRALLRDPEVWRHLGGVRTQDQAERAFATYLADEADGRVGAVRLGDARTLIGLLFLGAHHDEPQPASSPLFAPRFWGRRLAAECIRGLLVTARREFGLERIVAETQAMSRASHRLPERVGMTPKRRPVRFGEDRVLHATARRAPQSL